MEEKKYSGRGGWRDGGRPKGKKVNASITIRGTEEEIQAIKLLAEQEPCSLSRFCIDKLLKKKIV